MSTLLDLHKLLGTDVSKGKDPEKYGILVDTDRSSIVVLRFYNHHDLLDLILSDEYTHMILYRTQYTLPTETELLELNNLLFNE